MEAFGQDGYSAGADARVRKQLALLRTQEDRQLFYRDGDESTAVLRYLQRSVAARPLMLRQHIRRIYLAMQCGETRQLCGAVADLMLVLRHRGRQLQARIIEQVAPLLLPDQRERLRSALARNDLQELAALPLEESVLGNSGLHLRATAR